MLIFAGEHYWYPTHKKACRCTAFFILKVARGCSSSTGKEELYVVKSTQTNYESLSTPMKVVGSGMEQPTAGPERYPLFNTEREVIQYIAKQLRDEATQVISRLDDETDSDSPDNCS